MVLPAAGMGPSGSSDFRILHWGDAKNSLPPVMAVMGLQFGYLLGGSILVETVFTWPGSGFLLSKAIINRDVPVLQGTILTLSMVFVAPTSSSICCSR